MLQTPPVQPAVPFAMKHSLPQPPQCLTSPAVFTSQPFAALVSQSASGGLQALMPHLPSVQFGGPQVAEQTLPQAPQLSVLVLVLISQPLATLPSQFWKPGLQAMVQAPR